MSLNPVSPVTNRGVISQWLATEPTGVQLLAVDADGDLKYPTSAEVQAAADLPSALSPYQLISTLGEAIDDRVGALLVAGTGISLAYNDAGNLLTISSTIDTSVFVLKSGDQLTGTLRTTEVTSTPTGTTQTVNLASGNHQTLNLGSASGAVAVTLTVPGSSAAGTIVVLQGATVRNITWAVSSGSIVWMGTQPTWSGDSANSSRIVAWRWNGSVMRLAPTEQST